MLGVLVNPRIGAAEHAVRFHPRYRVSRVIVYPRTIDRRSVLSLTHALADVRFPIDHLKIGSAPECEQPGPG
jgi:hypothetical protein